MRAHVFQQHLILSAATIRSPISIRTAVISLRALLVTFSQMLLSDPSFFSTWVVSALRSSLAAVTTLRSTCSGSSLMDSSGKLLWSDPLLSSPRLKLKVLWEIRGHWNSISRGCVLMWVTSCHSVPLRMDFVLARSCTVRVLFVSLLRLMTASMFRFFVF